MFTNIFLHFFFLSFHFLMKFRFSLLTFIIGQPRTQIFSSLSLTSLPQSFLLVPLSEAHLRWHPHCSPHWQQDERRHRHESHRQAIHREHVSSKSKPKTLIISIRSPLVRSRSGYMIVVFVFVVVFGCQEFLCFFFFFMKRMPKK